MNHPIPTLTVAAVVAAAVVTGCFGSRNPQHACGRTAADAATVDSSDRTDSVLLRILAKDLVARDVLAGRRSAARAVALVRELNGRADGQHATKSPTPSDRDAVARGQLVEIVRGIVELELGMNPVYAQEVVAELEAAITRERSAPTVTGPNPDPDPREVEGLIERVRTRLARDRADSARANTD